LNKKPEDNKEGKRDKERIFFEEKSLSIVYTKIVKMTNKDDID
jgi:hypothetical protein